MTEPRTEAYRGYWGISGADAARMTPDVFAHLRQQLERATDTGETLIVVDGITLTWHPAEPLRAAITAAIADIRGRHVRGDRFGEDGLVNGDWCYHCDDNWPCPDVLLADRLEEATK